MTKQIIIISNQLESPWLATAIDALQSFGVSHVFSEENIFNQSSVKLCDLILIDASSINTDLVEMIKQLCRNYYKKPIVVMTNSPTWRRAKEVILAGAVEYTRRTFDRKKIVELCENAIKRYPITTPCQDK